MEPGLETPQNGFGSFEVVRISLQIPKCAAFAIGTSIGEGAYGLEYDIRVGGKFLQIRNIVEGPKNCLEPQRFKGLGLFGRAKEDRDLVVGSPGALDEMGKGAAANVSWPTGNEHLAPDSEPDER